MNDDTRYGPTRCIKAIAGDGQDALTAEKAMTDRTFTQAEVDTLVAAERALFAQKACEVVKRESNFASFHAVICERILALADTNALAEHDAALRAPLEQKIVELEKHSHFTVCSYCGKVSDCGSAELDAKRKVAMDHILECDKRPENQLIDHGMKLEAENAELRSKLGWAMGRAPQVVGWISCGEGTGIWRCFECYATGHSSPDSVEHKADCRWFQTRALLAKSGAEGR